jgi:ABC-2 type transport system permease protein
MSVGIFGAFFLVRAMGDVTNLSWLLNLTPLGWIEKLRPLYAPDSVWLIPIGGLVLVLGVATIYLAGKRDLGDSIFADRDSAVARTKLLNSPLGVAFRLTRINNLSWLGAISLVSLFFGLLTKSAEQALSASSGATRAFGKITHTTQAFGASTFLGLAFFLVMVVAMCFAANSIGHIREDEAEGYLDNLLVRSTSRLRWLSGRIFLALVVIALAGLLAGIFSYIGQSSQHVGLTYHSLLLSGINATVPAIFNVGLAVFALGFIPRFTTIIGFSLVGWSFLIQLLSSGINLNHWILDTSVLTHMALAPSSPVRWGTDLTIITIGAGLCLLGMGRFNARDLETE